MSINEVEDVLNKLKATGAHIYPHIKGEPLIHPEFEKIVKLISEHNMPLNVTTNGVFIKKHSGILLDTARQVNFSVHALSDGQIDDKENYMKDIISFGLMAMKNKKPNVSYRMWTEKKGEINKETLDIIKELEKSFGVDAKEEIKKGRNAVKLCDNVYISLMDKFEWPDLSGREKRSFGNCLGGKEMLGILADGTVVPCCLDGDGTISLGNIFKESLEDILKSERFLNLKNGFLGGRISEELCRKCSFYNSRKQK